MYKAYIQSLFCLRQQFLLLPLEILQHRRQLLAVVHLGGEPGVVVVQDLYGIVDLEIEGLKKCQ